MATGIQNNIAVKLGGTTVYTVRTKRNTADYPLTSSGELAMETDIHDGKYPELLTVEDNGATISPNTIPPSVKPAAPALGTPTGLTATASGQTQINLIWTAVTGATGYLLDRSADGLTGWTQIATPTGTSYTNTGLTAGTQYFYRLRAQNTVGNSGYTSAVSATTSNVYSAYSKKLQAEDATSNISFSGSSEDGNSRAFGSTPSDYMQWSITDATVSDSLYNMAIRFQTPDGPSPSVISLIINNVTTSVTLPNSGGSLQIKNVTSLALIAGSNTIRIQGSTGGFGIDYILITHAASS